MIHFIRRKLGFLENTATGKPGFAYNGAPYAVSVYKEKKSVFAVNGVWLLLLRLSFILLGITLAKEERKKERRERRRKRWGNR